MTHILHIDSSANLTTSTSRAASAKLVAEIRALVTYRDLAAAPLPQIDGAWADVRLTDPATRSNADKARLADVLVAELQAADTIIIGAPIYNFASPGMDGSGRAAPCDVSVFARRS
jgi:FMN-dependent NADH-azoreductase